MNTYQEFKRIKMDRTSQRQWVVKVIYQIEFYDIDKIEIDEILNNHEIKEFSFIQSSVRSIVENMEEIDQIISDNLYNWNIKRIPLMDKAILRVAINEFVIQKSVPTSVAINEAVENAKLFSNAESYKFINGVLSSISKGI